MTAAALDPALDRGVDRGTGAGSGRLPDGFRVTLRPDVLRVDRGRVLVGGSPTRAVRLSPRARALLAGDRLTVTDAATAALARRLLDGNLADPDLDGVARPHGRLTVVVPVRDRAAQLDRCLTALAGLPVVVVDDASRDPAAVPDVADRLGATVVMLADNVGPAGARNVGLARVTTPFVAFVDSDVVVEAATLLRLARHCADPAVALVGPRVVGETRAGRPRWFERYDAVASSLDLGSTSGQVRAGAAVGWLPSACLVGRVAALRDPRIGGFAAGMRVAEDVDLGWRLVDAGRVVRYDAAERARHDVRTTVRAWLGRKFVYGTGGADLARRHGDKVAPGVLTALTALGAAAVLQRRWWSMPVAAVTVAATTRSLRGHLPVESGRTRLAARFSLRGLGWGVRQESGLLLRHWWPAAAAGAVVSRPVRRALLTAVAVDLVVSCRERPGAGVLTTLVGRRCDDVAYGAGLWWGALRRRNLRCLALRRAGAPRR